MYSSGATIAYGKNNMWSSSTIGVTEALIRNSVNLNNNGDELFDVVDEKIVPNADLPIQASKFIISSTSEPEDGNAVSKSYLDNNYLQLSNVIGSSGSASSSNVYNASTIDSKLAEKADSDSVYTKTETDENFYMRSDPVDKLYRYEKLEDTSFVGTEITTSSTANNWLYKKLSIVLLPGYEHENKNQKVVIAEAVVTILTENTSVDKLNLAINIGSTNTSSDRFRQMKNNGDGTYSLKTYYINDLTTPDTSYMINLYYSSSVKSLKFRLESLDFKWGYGSTSDEYRLVYDSYSKNETDSSFRKINEVHTGGVGKNELKLVPHAESTLLLLKNNSDECKGVFNNGGIYATNASGQFGLGIRFGVGVNPTTGDRGQEITGRYDSFLYNIIGSNQYNNTSSWNSFKTAYSGYNNVNYSFDNFAPSFKVLQDNYYDRSTIDSKIAEKANSSDVDTQLSIKANTNDVYSKVDSDGKYRGKKEVHTGGVGSSRLNIIPYTDESYSIYRLLVKYANTPIASISDDGLFTTKGYVYSGEGYGFGYSVDSTGRPVDRSADNGKWSASIINVITTNQYPNCSSISTLKSNYQGYDKIAYTLDDFVPSFKVLQDNYYLKGSPVNKILRKVYLGYSNPCGSYTATSTVQRIYLNRAHLIEARVYTINVSITVSYDSSTINIANLRLFINFKLDQLPIDNNRDGTYTRTWTINKSVGQVQEVFLEYVSDYGSIPFTITSFNIEPLAEVEEEANYYPRSYIDSLEARIAALENNS